MTILTRLKNLGLGLTNNLRIFGWNIVKQTTYPNIVVCESTVYPGVTENVCGPVLESVSELKSGVDFNLGYSSERINLGDTEHTIENVTKIVDGQTEKLCFLPKFTEL